MIRLKINVNSEEVISLDISNVGSTNHGSDIYFVEYNTNKRKGTFSVEHIRSKGIIPLVNKVLNEIHERYY